jgi:hypothetical protein
VHDLLSNLVALPAISPVIVTDNTAQTTGVLDLVGYSYAELVVATGTLADTDATFAVQLTAGNAVDSVSSPTVITDSAVADSNCVIGSANFDFSGDNKVFRVGYRPSRGDGKRYLKATITPSANSGTAPLSAIWYLIPTQRPGGSAY